MRIVAGAMPIGGTGGSLRPENKNTAASATPITATVLATTMIIVAASAGSAEAAQSRFTSIANKDCTFAPVGDEPGEDDDQLKTCRGLGGAQVLVNAMGTRLRIGFHWPKGSHPKKVVWVAEAWSAGFTMDWRGLDSGKGFAPYAAIVRMKFARDGGPEVGDQVLAVIRIGHGDACVMGAVDTGANRNANELAREIADARPSFICGKDRPVIGGIGTPSGAEIIRGVVDQ